MLNLLSTQVSKYCEISKINIFESISGNVTYARAEMSSLGMSKWLLMWHL